MARGPHQCGQEVIIFIGGPENRFRLTREALAGPAERSLNPYITDIPALRTPVKRLIKPVSPGS